MLSNNSSLAAPLYSYGQFVFTRMGNTDDGSLDISDTVMLEYDSPLGIASAVEDGSLPSASPHTLGAVSIEYDSPLGFPSLESMVSAPSSTVSILS